MKIGFLNNQIDNRGTGNAVYNYARYNEEILHNESVIFTFPASGHNEKAVDKFTKRFKYIYNVFAENAPQVDAIYHIKYGDDDGFRPLRGEPYLVHAVFDAGHPHGDRYVAISEWLGQKHSIPFVPHIVEVPPVNTFPDSFRPSLGIADDAIVLGRIGGYDSFDIPFVWEALEEALNQRENLWVFLVNTPYQFNHSRIRYFPETSNDIIKSMFINTCNAMIHARARGETFGISVGEFALKGKPIFTYGDSYEKAHYYELKGTARKYFNKNDLLKQLLEYKGELNHPFYLYTPYEVMHQFKKEFLDGIS